MEDGSNFTEGIDNVTLRVRMLEAQMGAMQDSINDIYQSIVSILIYFMQCGFAFLEAGSIRSKNVTNILIKNMMDSFVGTLSYLLFGYALKHGQPSSGFCGAGNFALSGVSRSSYSKVFLGCVFATTSATIVSGAVAERCEFTAYMLFTVFITGCVHPIAAHWTWAEDGWLKNGPSVQLGDETVQLQYQDFAGSGLVHLLGGTSSFVAAWILKPRRNRFDAATGLARDIRGHSVPLVCLGAFILFFGFFAFNGGSHSDITEAANRMSVPMINTAVSGCVAAFTTLVAVRLFRKNWSLLSAVNGALTGMVSICSCCNSVAPWSSVCIGFLASVTYQLTSRAVLKLKVDDPIEAVGVHFGGGLLGVAVAGLFDEGRGVLLLWTRGSGLQLAWQLLGAACICAWAAAASFGIFGSLQLLKLFRVTAEEEDKGLDVPLHGEPAYPLMAYGHGWVERIPELSLMGIELFSQRRRRKISQRSGQPVQLPPNTVHRDRLFNDKNLPEVGAAIRDAARASEESAAASTSRF